MKIVDFPEYKILDLASGKKIESWNSIILSRPDPQIIWNEKRDPKVWQTVNATYERSKSGGGSWDKEVKPWQIHYKDLTFNLKLMGFKHTGLFPEQAFNWDLIRNKIKTNKNVKVLNLFAYTGGASVAALAAGAEVVHVDSSKGMIEWAKENVKSSNLEDKPIRFLVDDVVKFVKREIRRGNKYDIIIMDPPSFGRGNSGEIWDIEKDLYNLVKDCVELLSDNPLMFIINSYTTGLSKIIMEDVLQITVGRKYKGKIESNELCLPVEKSKIILPCGVTTRWEA